MNKVIFYGAILLGLFMALSYYAGATSLLSTGGTVGVNLANAFSGRKADGTPSGYAPKV